MLYLLLFSVLEFLSPSQEKCVGEQKDGKKNGPWKCYYEDGKLQTEGAYLNDLKQGAWKLYHSNGKLAGEGSYEMDHEKGKWKFYDEAGQLLMEQDY
jgi:antitoxin component YwqK of YwqJK toxin-antitoxin module